MPEEARRVASAAISHRIRSLSCVAAVRTILGYAPVGAEADPALSFFDPAGHRLTMLVPASGAPSDPPRWVPVDGWPGGVGSGASARDLTYPLVVLVPGVGFDHCGMRLGRGAGFYDRALAELRHAGCVHAVGLAFECQIVPLLPSDPWDQRVDFIASEQRLLDPTKATGLRRVAATS
jgi:5-formyltetrahydrofolate cyclo-ligase